MNEAAAADDIVSTGLSRTLTVYGNPAVAPALYEADPTKGARVFDGATTYADGALATGDHVALVAGRVSFDCWLSLDTVGTEMCVLAFENANKALALENCLFSVRVNTLGDVFTRWNKGVGVDVDATGPRLVAGTRYHLGITVEPDPAEFNRLRVAFFVDGIMTHRIGDLEYPAGGSSAYWIMGATVQTGALASYLDGTLDDVAVYTFSASSEFHRHVYARGVKDWLLNPDNVDLPFFETHTRVLIEDRLGALGDSSSTSVDGFVDMTSLFGWNWLLEATIEEDIDAQAMSATVSLVSRYGEMNLAPGVETVTTGGVDFYQNVINANDTFLAENNAVKIEVAVVPYGTGRAGAAAFWVLRFHGLIARVDAGDERTTIQAVDRMGALQDVWIEPDPLTGLDYEYGSTPFGTAVEDIMAAVIEDNDPARYPIQIVDDNGGGNKVQVLLYAAGVPSLGKPHLFDVADRFLVEDTVGYDGEYDVDVVPSAGVSIRATQTTGGGVAAETTGTVRGLEREFGYFGGLPEIYVPTSPGWVLLPKRLPASQNVATALEGFASPIGYAVRYAWDDDRQEFRLTLSRFAGVAAAVLSLRNVLQVGAQRADKENARNVLETEFSNDADLDAEGNRRRNTVVATTPATRRRFGRRYARVGVASYSLVNTEPEAQEFTDQMASDLDNPLPEGDLEMLFHPQVVPGGYLSIPAEAIGLLTMQLDCLPRAFPAGASMGVRRVATSLDGRGARMRVTTRKSEDGAVRTVKHRDFIQQLGYIPTRGLFPPSTDGITVGSTAVTLGGATRGGYITWSAPTNVRAAAWDYTEVHIADSAFAFLSGLDATTLKGSTRGTFFLAMGLVAATTYHVRLRLRDRMGNESAPIVGPTFTTAA